VNEYKEPILDLKGKLLPGICPVCLGKKKIVQRFKTFANLKYKNVPCRRCGGSGTVKIIGGTK
jgi:DnaJ-class molecular chaperone